MRKKEIYMKVYLPIYSPFIIIINIRIYNKKKKKKKKKKIEFRNQK